VSPPSTSTDQDRAAHARTYAIGIGLLATSLFLSGVLGILQEKTYKQYGGHWREGVFYTVRSRPPDGDPNPITRLCIHQPSRAQHALALPIFAFLVSDVQRGLKVLSRDEVLSGGAALFSQLPIPASILDKVPIDSIVVKPIYVVLLMNLVTQLVCVSGVNRLTSVRPPIHPSSCLPFKYHLT
jgi:UDP-xylose/UDP-N-acetylglucosamine transporter B4